jgi:hypothetical protein
LGDHKSGISQIPHAGQIENLIVLHPYSKGKNHGKQAVVYGSAARAFGARADTKEAQLKEVHAQMTENLKKYGPGLGLYLQPHGTQSSPKIGDTFSLMGLAEPRIEPKFRLRACVGAYSGTDEIPLFHSLSCFSTRVWSSSPTCGTMEAIARIARSMLV